MFTLEKKELKRRRADLHANKAEDRSGGIREQEEENERQEPRSLKQKTEGL